MFDLGMTPLGITLVLVGLAFLGLAPLLLRSVPRLRRDTAAAPVLAFPLDVAPSEDAIILIESGGRARFLNARAREWFNLGAEDLPNLETMARSVRPAETFLSLCATAGQSRFTLGKFLVEGTSYSLPFMGERAILLTLRRPQLVTLENQGGGANAQTFTILAEISQAMSASLDLETTITTILENVDRLVQSDFSEITLWDPDTEELTPYRYTAGLGGESQLEKSTTRYKVSQGYSGYLINERRPLLVNDIDSYLLVRPALDRKEFPFKSYLGIPLVVAGQQIGTLELASQGLNAFAESDLEILTMLSGQAAVALQNAIIHHEEGQRVAEISGLADLAKVGSSIRDEHQLYERLTASIGRLLDVEIIGFLIYHEGERLLQGKIPFQGLPDNFVELYRAEVPVGGPGERVWNSGDVIFTDNAAEDSALTDLGIAHLALAAAIERTVLIPLAASGRALGYLQVANKRDGSRFNDDDLRLLTIVAGQAAPILDNAALMRESRRRAQRAETLRRIASLAGADATLDEILKFSLMETARFFGADHAAIYLRDETRGELRLHRDSLVGMAPELIDDIERLATHDEAFRQSVTATGMPLLIPDTRTAILPPFYKTILGRFAAMRSVMVVPLTIRDRGVGELLVASRRSGDFDQNDTQSLSTAGSQLANAIERSQLYAQTDVTLQRRVEHLTALSSISRELNTTLNLHHLVQRVYDEAMRTTSASGGKIVLLDLESSNGHGERRILLNLGQIETENEALTPLEERVLAEGEPLIVDDFERGSETPSRPGVRSALLVPIAFQETTAGLIHLYARQPDHFDAVALEITQALAVQAAIALGNAQRYQHQVERGEVLNRRVDAFNRLFETTRAVNLEMPLEEALEIIAFGVREANLFNVVLIYAFDPQHEVLRAASGAGLPLETLEQVRQVLHPWSELESLLHAERRRSDSYFIPHTEAAGTVALVPAYAGTNYTIPENSANAWMPGDLLLVPLRDASKHPLGVIAVDAPPDGLRPDTLTIETLEIFATEAALVIESALRLRSLRERVDEIEGQIGRAERSSRNAQDNLSILLHKDLEQTLTIQQLYDRARNIRIGLDIAETVNRQPDREAVLQALGQELITRLEMDSALVVEPASSGPRLLQRLGNLPETANPQALLGQRNPLRQTLLNGKPILVSDLDQNAEWQNTPLLKNLNAKGFVTLPISSNGHVDAAVLAVSNTAMPAFNEEDQQIFDLIGSQVAIALQNINLLTETRRRLREVNLLLEFSQQLGSLSESQILATLVESARKALTSAHAGLVALWNSSANELVIHAASGYSDNDLVKRLTFSRNEALPGQVFAANAARRVHEVDFARHYNLSPEKLLIYREATGGRVPVSSMLIPIRAGDKAMGLITLDNFNTQNAFSAEDEALVTSLTQQTGLTLENARLFEESRRLNEQLEERVRARTDELEREHHFMQALLRISAELSASLDLDHVLNRSLEELNQAVNAEQSSIIIVRPGEENLVYRAGIGISGAAPTGGRPSSYRVGEGLAGWVIQNRSPLVIPDLSTDERWIGDRGDISVHRSAIVVPLTVGADALGALMLYHREPNHFTEYQIDAVQAAANQFAVSINNGELFRLIRDQAADLGTMLRSQQIEASRSTAMLEGVADGILVTDHQNAITLFNDAAATILLLEQQEVVGRSLDNFLGLFGAAAQPWMAAIRGWSEAPAGRAEGEQYSERLSLDDGRVVSVHLAPVYSASEFLGTVSIFRDITHQVEVDRLKSEFVATVSHELRTPLTPIKGYVEFMMMGGAGELNEQQRQFMEIISSNIDRLSVLVNDLLDVSRIEAGKVALSMQPLNMQEIAEEVVEYIERKSQEENRPMGFQIQCPPNLPNAYGDAERIRQVFSNIIDNAYRYTPEDGRIIVGLKAVNGNVQVDVKDSGIGIFPDEQDRIFDRFYRGENHLVMATSGTGLGLAIVKELIEMHNGRIWVESSGMPGQGSTFSFVLPAYKPEQKEDSSEEA
ncbi:MAG: GAF domain-containing protein [Anaerolineae bacterium]|nr:MAG: GAF domain-containing protein [Anaerolineae bacterium]